MKKERTNEILHYLNGAIKSFEEGLNLFPEENYKKTLPEDKEKQVKEYCKKCSKNMGKAQELDTDFSQVYQYFYDGGEATNCRLGKNIWCYAKIEFVRTRIDDLIRNPID
ncbi:MAG: hypothetical protein JSV92_00555 [archaeon]|nr:MAG: hypothetical protein JSV92_00555 [archaeon]